MGLGASSFGFRGFAFRGASVWRFWGLGFVEGLPDKHEFRFRFLQDLFLSRGCWFGVEGLGQG